MRDCSESPHNEYDRKSRQYYMAEQQQYNREWIKRVNEQGIILFVQFLLCFGILLCAVFIILFVFIMITTILLSVVGIRAFGSNTSYLP